MGGLPGPQFLDCDRRQHAAHGDWVRYFSCSWTGAWAGDRQQQVPGRNGRRTAGKPAESAEHLLAAYCRTVVRAQRESDSVCGGNGIAAIGHDQHGDRPEAAAENLLDGWAKSGGTWSAVVSACDAAGELAIHRQWLETRLGVRVEIVDLGRDDFRYAWSGTASHDGP